MAGSSELTGATVDGYTWRGSVARMKGEYLLGLNREVREAAGVEAAFDQLAYTHRKEFARWVGEAKREETRERRAAQAIEMLREGRTRS